MSTDPAARANHPPMWSHAHFSPAELNGMRHALAAADSNAQAATVVDPRACELRLRAERDTGAVLLALCGGYPEMPRKSDGSVTTRQEQIDAAWFHRERALKDCLPVALAELDRFPGRPAWQRSAYHLKNAIRYLEGLDTTLAYENPAPQPLLTLTINDSNGEPLTVPQTKYAVVGPHGVYEYAISQCFWMTHYARDMMDAVNKMLADKRYQKHHGHRLRDVTNMYREIQRWQYDCAGKVAGVVDDPADRFCSMLYVGDTLWSSGPKPGLPRWYFQLGVILSEVTTEDPVVRALFKAFMDLWLQSNRVIEGIFMENAEFRKRCGRPANDQ